MKRSLAETDKRHVWHPFTPMDSWIADGHEPLIVAKGQGIWLEDSGGNRYIDGNSSIWTNIHGHSHPTVVRAIRDQAERLAHASFLGFTNEPAIRLAERLTGLFPSNTLTRVFYSDDGSTAIECAAKMALQYWQLTGKPDRTRFLAFDRAYHGDTTGAASLGGIPLFHGRFQTFGLDVIHVESIDDVAALDSSITETVAGVMIEPMIQGAAGMRLWPKGMLTELRHWCDSTGALLVLDEVMTGFGRTGTMFACEQENVSPDLMALAKGLTGGTVPLAATLATETVFEAFLGSRDEDRTFYYGHSYCGNPLGCAAALASLDVFREEQTLEGLPVKIRHLATCLAEWKDESPCVGGIRQIGLIAGIDIVAADGSPYPASALHGAGVCRAARKHGLLTRPVRDTLVFMPPLCIEPDEITQAINALKLAATACNEMG